MPKLGAFRETLDGLLDDNSKNPKRERLTTKRIYEALRDTGYTGGYDVVAGMRSAGATDLATIRSFIATAKKQGWNVIQAIAQEPKVLANSPSERDGHVPPAPAILSTIQKASIPWFKASAHGGAAC
jgi:hypothetical protein